MVCGTFQNNEHCKQKKEQNKKHKHKKMGNSASPLFAVLGNEYIGKTTLFNYWKSLNYLSSKSISDSDALFGEVTQFTICEPSQGGCLFNTAAILKSLRDHENLQVGAFAKVFDVESNFSFQWKNFASHLKYCPCFVYCSAGFETGYWNSYSFEDFVKFLADYHVKFAELRRYFECKNKITIVKSEANNNNSSSNENASIDIVSSGDEESQQCLEKLRKQKKIPVLILAMKQDLPNAATPTEALSLLTIPIVNRRTDISDEERGDVSTRIQLAYECLEIECMACCKDNTESMNQVMYWIANKCNQMV